MSTRYHFLARCGAGHEISASRPLPPVEGEKCWNYSCPFPIVRWWYRREAGSPRWSTSKRYRGPKP